MLKKKRKGFEPFLFFLTSSLEIHLHPRTPAYIQFVEIRFHQIIQFRSEEERQMLPENVFGGELQEHAVDKPVFVRDEVALFGETVALFAAEQDAAGRHQHEPIQRDSVSVMNVPDPLGNVERIATGSVVTSSTIRTADTDDGMDGKVPVDVGTVHEAVRSVDTDLCR